MSLPAAAVTAFHRTFYKAREQSGWRDTTWAGVPTAKNPLDAWVLQEIIWETKPDLIIETGTYYGGSALFMAIVLDMVGTGRVLSIDLNKAVRPNHPRIYKWVQGDSTDPEIAEWVETLCHKRRVMVVLDSDHQCAHVRRELELYAPLVSPGCYLVVEDTNLNGHPVHWKEGKGPMEAVQAFLAGNDEFERDRTREKYGLTFNPSGWLRRREE